MISFNIIDSPDQKFSATLNGRRVSLRIRYNSSNDRWSMDVSIDGEAVLHGRKIVKGIDILKPFNFGIGLIFAQSEADAEAGRTQIPDGSVKIYHATQEEVDAAIS